MDIPFYAQNLFPRAISPIIAGSTNFATKYFRKIAHRAVRLAGENPRVSTAYAGWTTPIRILSFSLSGSREAQGDPWEPRACRAPSLPPPSSSPSSRPALPLSCPFFLSTSACLPLHSRVSSGYQV